MGIEDYLQAIQNITLTEAFLAFLLALFFLWLIEHINAHISRLALYHEAKCKFNNNGEPLILKIFLVFISYLNLTVPVFLSIYISIKFLPINGTLTPDEIKSFSDATILYTFIGTLTFLFLMRLLMNPTQANVDVLLKIRVIKFDEGIMEEIKKFKDRIHSFFFSYICITLIIAIFYLLVILEGSQSYSSLEERISLFIPIIDRTTFAIDIVGFFISLTILTLFLEIVLWKAYPVIRIPWKRKTKQEPLTVENFKTFRLSARDWLLYHFNLKVSLIREIPSKAISFFKFKIGCNK
jgi:hypothetical protein